MWVRRLLPWHAPKPQVHVPALHITGYEEAHTDNPCSPEAEVEARRLTLRLFLATFWIRGHPGIDETVVRERERERIIKVLLCSMLSLLLFLYFPFLPPLLLLKSPLQLSHKDPHQTCPQKQNLFAKELARTLRARYPVGEGQLKGQLQ